MKILLDIKDEKAVFIMELLRNFPFVKAKPFTEKPSKKNDFLSELQEAVEQVNLAKRGKIKLKSADELLNEL